MFLHVVSSRRPRRVSRLASARVARAAPLYPRPREIAVFVAAIARPLVMSAPTLGHHVPVLRGPHRDVGDAEDAAHEVPERRRGSGLNVLCVVLPRERRRAAGVVVLARGLHDELGELLELERADAGEERARRRAHDGRGGV